MGLNSKPKVEIIKQNSNLDFEYSLPTKRYKISRIIKNNSHNKNKLRKNLKNEDYEDIDFRKVKYIEINEDNDDYYDQENIFEEYETEPQIDQSDSNQTEPIQGYETKVDKISIDEYPNVCYPNPCNSGKCERLQNDYYCKCPPSTYGKNCHLCK